MIQYVLEFRKARDGSGRAKRVRWTQPTERAERAANGASNSEGVTEIALKCVLGTRVRSGKCSAYRGSVRVDSRGKEETRTEEWFTKG